ncbi:MAG: ATP-binding protein [Steroidobacteraceae bacterium]
MEKLTGTLRGRIALAVILVHAVLLPALYLSLSYILTRSHTSLFVSQVRTFARLVADEFELGDALQSDVRSISLLDSVILSGEGVYATLVVGDQQLRSSVGTLQLEHPPADDFQFGAGGDSTYFLTVPIERPPLSATLHLGFDETLTAAEIATSKTRVLLAMAVYFTLLLTFGIYLATRLSRPLQVLALASRRVASGETSLPLATDSTFVEVRDLAHDLERMRQQLVGVNERLRGEIDRRARLEAERLALERQLRHKKNLETIGTLAGGIAHEINNTLVPIQLFTETARDDTAADSQARRDLDRVLQATGRAKRIVREILTFSRQLDEEVLTPIDIAPVVRDALHVFEALIAPNIELAVDIPVRCPPIRAQDTLITQVVMNLCSNAYQAMQPDGGRLAVSLGTAPADSQAPQGWLRLAISDSGHGMDKQVAERIFEPFFTTREVGEGTGLGLSVVHGIATSLNASIDVDSEPGQGTTITLSFPIAAGDNEPSSGAS